MFTFVRVSLTALTQIFTLHVCDLTVMLDAAASPSHKTKKISSSSKNIIQRRMFVQPDYQSEKMLTNDLHTTDMLKLCLFCSIFSFHVWRTPPVFLWTSNCVVISFSLKVEQPDVEELSSELPPNKSPALLWALSLSLTWSGPSQCPARHFSTTHTS